ncbi:MAG: hypothetical protein GY943_07250 [Chloroflexi bacterium]|nr:hypothetical protein [Chloroflexota bacterium]
MGFFKKLFGGSNKKASQYVDKTGIYFYVQVNNRDSRVRVRADKQHDLMRTGNGYEWHKTIVDSKYFQRMQALVQFDGNYNITNAELDGGTFITEETYNTAEAAAVAAKEAEKAAREAANNSKVDEVTDETTS